MYVIINAGDKMERLQKVIANSGFTSRRKAEDLILKKKVKVDGVIVDKLGLKVGMKAVIEVDGTIILKQQEKVYYILNKPRGVVTTTKDQYDRKTVVELIDTPERIYPVGRLDFDTTGLLILTNDGEFANKMMHPSSEVEKVYIAKVKGIPTGKDIAILKDGVLLDGVKTAKARVKLKKKDVKTNTSVLEITIYEGRNHQVKRMFESVGYEVLKLKREKIAFLTLDGLKSGEYRKLNQKELSKLYALYFPKEKSDR